MIRKPIALLLKHDILKKLVTLMPIKMPQKNILKPPPNHAHTDRFTTTVNFKFNHLFGPYIFTIVNVK